MQPDFMLIEVGLYETTYSLSISFSSFESSCNDSAVISLQRYSKSAQI